MEIKSIETKSFEISLKYLRLKAVSHPAFLNKIKASRVGGRNKQRYNMNVKIEHTPKFHGEINPLKKNWAKIKNNLRKIKINDQRNYGEFMEKRIIETKDLYNERIVNYKLWRRIFWKL